MELGLWRYLHDKTHTLTLNPRLRNSGDWWWSCWLVSWLTRLPGTKQLTDFHICKQGDSKHSPSNSFTKENLILHKSLVFFFIKWRHPFLVLYVLKFQVQNTAGVRLAIVTIICNSWCNSAQHHNLQQTSSFNCDRGFFVLWTRVLMNQFLKNHYLNMAEIGIIDESNSD